jgi:hypothetical protein
VGILVGGELAAHALRRPRDGKVSSVLRRQNGSLARAENDAADGPRVTPPERSPGVTR